LQQQKYANEHTAAEKIKACLNPAQLRVSEHYAEQYLRPEKICNASVELL